jgi:class 3 adenylate cyclase/tetratricopeptide (TPR) repeat protein
MPTNRQLAAILFTDIVGYSAMMQKNELLANRVRTRHREVLREVHEKYHGRILQFYGDGTLSIFNSSVAAVECAVEMQIAFRQEPEVPLRIGIHVGDVTYDEEGAYGDSVNIASRIENICVTGGVYISEKVYDDIKNHPWLTAYSLGMMQLRNIFKPMEIYAITSKGMALPTREEMSELPLARPVRREAAVKYESAGKNKWVASILAFFFGFFGLHRLYLGKRFMGIIWLVLAIMSIVITAEEDVPVAAIFGILGFIDFILLLAMPKSEFDRKFNRKKVSAEATPRRIPIEKVRRRQRQEQPVYQLPRSEVKREHIKAARQDPNKMRGIKLFRNGHYLEAIDFFEEALKSNQQDVPTHFNLACCHSLLENSDDAFYHLGKAVEFGLSDKEKIKTHDALAFLRSREEWDDFVDNDYKLLKALPEPDTELSLEKRLDYDFEKIDLLEQLGEKLEKGELSQEEFEVEKKKLLDQ